MTCHSVLPQLDDYLDRELGRREMARLDAHLAACEPCRADLAARRRLIGAIRRRLRDVTPPPDLMRRLRLGLGLAAPHDPPLRH